MTDFTDPWKIHFLWHQRLIEPPETFDSKMIGLFGTLGDAEVARVQVASATGFRDFPDDFIVETLPIDEILYDLAEAGLVQLVSAFIADEAASTSKLSDAPLERFDRILQLGTGAIWNVIEELHAQERDLHAAELLERKVVRAWIVRSVERRRHPSDTLSTSAVSADGLATQFWGFRRLGYPVSPDWFSDSYSQWRSGNAAHRSVVIFDGLDNRSIVALIVALLNTSQSDDERQYVANGPLSTFVTRIRLQGASSAAKLVERADALSSILSEEQRRELSQIATDG